MVTILSIIDLGTFWDRVRVVCCNRFPKKLRPTEVAFPLAERGVGWGVR